MKNSLILAALALLIALPVGAATNPFDGKAVALDAGHGAADTGATGYCGETAVREVDVNLAVRAELGELLRANGASVYDVPQLDSRRNRVAAAEEAGADVLISIHHNGSSNTSADYTQSFVTQKNDKEFAKHIHPALVAALGLPDRGIKNDGYGMTVYGSLPGILTEAYFITNTAAACDFLGPRLRITAEAQALYDGLTAYFSRSVSGGGKGRNQ